MKHIGIESLDLTKLELTLQIQLLIRSFQIVLVVCRLSCLCTCELESLHTATACTGVVHVAAAN